MYCDLSLTSVYGFVQQNSCRNSRTSLGICSYLAKFILALCPPLSVTPRSPTIVLSPYGNCSKSFRKAHTSTTYKRFVAHGKKNSINK